MTRIVPFTEARARLTELLDDVEARHEHLVSTRRGRPETLALAQLGPETGKRLVGRIEGLWAARAGNSRANISG